MNNTLVSKNIIFSCLKKYDIQIEGKEEFLDQYQVSSLDLAEENSISWFKGANSDLLKTSKASIIICGNELEISEDLLESKTFIKVENPKFVIAKLIEECYTEKLEGQIHPTAFIHKDAKIGKNVYVGPFVYIGKAIISDNVILWGHVYIHDQVVLKENVEIHAGCVIGEIGSGFAKNEKGEFIKFPHIGGVILEENVEVGALTYINRGSLSDTLVKKGAKIGNSVCIGHNVVIGENSMVIANSVIAGSTVIGKNCWIAHSCSIRNNIRIGDNVFIGMGSNVTKNFESNMTLFGNPARDEEDYKKWNVIMKKLLNQ